MKFFRLFLFIPFLVPAQTDSKFIFKNARLTQMKWTDQGYICIIDNPAREESLQKYLLTQKPANDYGNGLALIEKDGQIKFIYMPENGHVIDFRVEDNVIYILETVSQHMKNHVKSVLIEEKLNMNGEKLSDKEITSLDVYSSGARIEGKYSADGHLWTCTNWGGTTHLKIDKKDLSSVEDECYLMQLFDHKLKKTGSHLITGYDLRLNTWDVKSNPVFIFTGVSSSLDDIYNIERSGTRVLMIDSKNKIRKMELIGRKLYPENMQITEKGIFLAGTFQGNDSVKTEGYAHLSGISLASPKNGFRKEQARNGFIASFTDSLKLNWVKILSCNYDVDLRSMSPLGDSVAFSFTYKDEVKIGNDKIVSLKKQSKYEYSDAAIGFLNQKGNLTGFERTKDEGSHQPEVVLSKHHLILQGHFNKWAEIYDEKFNVSDGGDFYLWFKTREARNK